MKNKKFLIGLLLSLIVVCFAVIAVAQEPAAAAAGAPAVHKKTLVDLIKSGGWAMWPLGACSFATITMIVINFQRVSSRKMMPPNVISDMEMLSRGEDFQKLWDMASKHDSFFTRSLVAGLKYINPEDPLGSKSKMETAIGEAVGREESRYGYFINFLSLLTSMSPMWGLLGTVSGMIGAFSKIGQGGMGKPEMLAANIAEALVCTATGLLVAICAMFFYFYFRNLLNAILKQAEGKFSVILDNLTGSGSVMEEKASTETPS